eukprot:TRINITY_DN14131_c0_g1_i1.p1 TRINITY_DN14131_c0_g1~~TRINITY_DN14131_c0_g1_i1.p1  ORF type:complete len:651 (-),score=166.09 TRINITY_DN14131_c0_g1_i1:9-1961(-)
MEGDFAQKIEVLIEELYSGLYQVLNIYLFGSRLHQCATQSSDYDYIVILEGPYFFGSKVHDDGIFNLNSYHRKHFQDLITENIVWAMMVNWLPQSCILKETHKFSENIRLPTLKRAILMDSSHNFAKAKRLWMEGDHKKAKKNIVHGLRWLMFGEQIIETGRIEDFTLGNNYWNEVTQDPAKEWGHYEAKFRPLYKTMMHKIRHEESKNLFEPSKDKNPLIYYIKKFGVESLSFDYSVCVSSQSVDNLGGNLVHITRDHSSPMDNPIVKLCSGVVLYVRELDCPAVSPFPTHKADDESFQFEVLSMPFEKFEDYDWERRKQLKIEGPIYKRLDGMLACLYFFNNSWNISTTLSSDGSEVYYYTQETLLQPTDIDTEKWKRNFKTVNQLKKWQVVDTHEGGLLLNSQMTSITFKHLFWTIWNNLNYQLPENKQFCYIFQLIHPLTVSVMKTVEVGDLVLIGIRNLVSMEELPIHMFAFSQYAWKALEPITLQWEELMNNITTSDPLQNPGYVYCSPENQRTNILNPQYAALKDLHPWNDKNKNWKLMLDLVRTNANYNFMDNFPEWMELFEEVEKEYGQFCEDVQRVYQSIRFADGSTYAKIANQEAYYGILFQIRKEGLLVDLIRPYLSNIRLQWLISIIRGWKQGRKRV